MTIENETNNKVWIADSPRCEYEQILPSWHRKGVLLWHFSQCGHTQSSLRKVASPHRHSAALLTLQRHFPRVDPAGGSRDSINESFSTHQKRKCSNEWQSFSPTRSLNANIMINISPKGKHNYFFKPQNIRPIWPITNGTNKLPWFLLPPTVKTDNAHDLLGSICPSENAPLL